MTAPAAGWYPDPHVPQQMRWWDGAAWSDDTYERTEPFADFGVRPDADAPSSPSASPAPSAPSAPSSGPAGPPAGPGGTGTGRVPEGAGRAVDTATRPEPGRTAGQNPYAPRSSSVAGPHRAAPTTDDGVPLAAWGWRAVARIADSVIAGLLALLVAFPVTLDLFRTLVDASELPTASAQWDATMQALSAQQLVWVSLVQLLVSLAYEMGFLLWKGATPGKLVVGLRVRTWEGSRLTPTVVARRWVASDGASTVPYVGTPYYFLDIIWPVRDVRRQALHDKFAGTCVITTRR